MLISTFISGPIRLRLVTLSVVLWHNRPTRRSNLQLLLARNSILPQGVGTVDLDRIPALISRHQKVPRKIRRAGIGPTRMPALTLRLDAERIGAGPMDRSHKVCDGMKVIHLRSCPRQCASIIFLDVALQPIYRTASMETEDTSTFAKTLKFLDALTGGILRTKKETPR